MVALKIDIVSDVVCPWCVVGFKQLEKALMSNQVRAEVHWQPFELNPSMPADGQNLTEHITEKYGITEAQSTENRERLVAIGNSLDFSFAFTPESRMVNTFHAHQLLHWAGLRSLEHESQLKQRLFDAYFTYQLDVSDTGVLCDVVEAAGLDEKEALSVLEDERFALEVRQRQKLWTDRGISGVPAMVFNDQYLITGAQGADNYVSVIKQVLDPATHS